MMTAYKLQIPGLDDAWKTFLFDENNQIFAPVAPFMNEHVAAAHAEFQGVQLAWYLGCLYAPAQFLADELPDQASKIRILIVELTREFADDRTRQPYPETSDDPVIRSLVDAGNDPAPEAFN
jgi:hypothetical protein